jgi:hypothetical protein
VEDKARAVAVFSLNGVVEADGFPVVYALGFAFDEVAPHGEIRLREIERIFEVLRHDNRPEAVEKRGSVVFWLTKSSTQNFLADFVIIPFLRCLAIRE